MGLVASQTGPHFVDWPQQVRTWSFHKLLRKNGYSSIHYDQGRLACRIQANFTFSKPLLDLQYLGSCFIYNMRDVSRWVDSRMNHHKGKYARAYLNRMRRAYDDPSLTLEDLRQHCHEAWQRNDLDLKRYFAGRSNFF